MEVFLPPNQELCSAAVTYKLKYFFSKPNDNITFFFVFIIVEAVLQKVCI